MAYKYLMCVNDIFRVETKFMNKRWFIKTKHSKTLFYWVKHTRVTKGETFSRVSKKIASFLKMSSVDQRIFKYGSLQVQIYYTLR